MWRVHARQVVKGANHGCMRIRINSTVTSTNSLARGFGWKIYDFISSWRHRFVEYERADSSKSLKQAQLTCSHLLCNLAGMSVLLEH